MPGIDDEVKQHVVNFRALNLGRLEKVQELIDKLKAMCFNAMPDPGITH
jgi:hypothetical protein